MKLQKALSWGIKSVKAAGIQDAHIDVLVFLSCLLSKEKSYIYSNLSSELSDFTFEKFMSMVEKRTGHYPSAYIIRQKEFMSSNFFVNESVLIPRPETEILVEEVLKLFFKIDDEPRIGLDIGTGCGNIALSLAKYNKNFHIYATDVSSKALEVARKNRKRMNLGKTVSFVECDLWAHFKNEKWKGQIDFLISNPPYIESGQLSNLDIDLSYEPKKALDGGADGLSFYEPLTNAGKFLLKKGGYLIMEIGQGQAEAVKGIVQSKKVFQDIIIKKDYSDIDRVIIARRK